MDKGLPTQNQIFVEISDNNSDSKEVGLISELKTKTTTIIETIINYESNKIKQDNRTRRQSTHLI